MFPPEKYKTTREYHGVVRGYILNEIFRRIEPNGRTMGEYLREEIGAPMGVDIHFGVQEADLERVSDVKTWGAGTILYQSLLPRFLGRKMIVSTFDVISSAKNVWKSSFPGRGIRVFHSLI